MRKLISVLLVFVLVCSVFSAASADSPVNSEPKTVLIFIPSALQKILFPVSIIACICILT